MALHLAGLLATLLALATVSATPFRGTPVNVDPNSIYTGGSCRERGLCCSGRVPSCAIPINRPGGQVSILGNLISAADNSAKECYCDSACITLGDCCPDYKDTCGGMDTTKRKSKLLFKVGSSSFRLF